MTQARLLGTVVRDGCKRYVKQISKHEIATERFSQEISRMKLLQALADAAVQCYGDRAPVSVSLDDFGLIEGYCEFPYAADPEE